MATVPKFQINGVLSTDNAVLQNLNDLCNSCGSWMTFDPNTGLWSVVINKPSDSVKSFDDSNIIGSINISGTGINEFYNSVSVEFPHKDLRDQTDYVDYKIPDEDRFPNEQDNALQMSLKYINDPVQAAYIGQVELKQARVDKVIEFSTDYSAIGIRAGDIIDVTSKVYGYINKKFRVTKLQEADDDNGSIVLKITALEYDDGVYDDTGLIRTERTKKTGIVPKSMNAALSESDANALNKNIKLELTPNAFNHGLVLYYYEGTPYNTWKIGYNEASTNQSAVINADNVVITWRFNDGEDLDIRCRMVTPFLGQSSVDDYLGYTGNAPTEGAQFPPGSTAKWPAEGTPYMLWGGDNIYTGCESVALNLGGLKQAFPTQRYLVAECRGNWYTKIGPSGCSLSAALYAGGVPSLSGFSFTVNNYTEFKGITSLTKHITSNVQGDPDGAETLGELISYFVFDRATNTAYFSDTLPE